MYFAPFSNTIAFSTFFWKTLCSQFTRVQSGPRRNEITRSLGSFRPVKLINKADLFLVHRLLVSKPGFALLEAFDDAVR